MKNKGYVLTLDAAVSVFIVLTILGYASTLVNDSRVTQWSEYQMLSTGYDITTVLKNNGVLQSMNDSFIEESINSVLSGNYELRLEVTSYRDVDGSLVEVGFMDVGPEVKESELRTHGRSTYVTFAGNLVDTYNAVEFWIWLK